MTAALYLSLLYKKKKKDMDIKVSIVVKSHLNDIDIEMNFDKNLVSKRLQFVKLLLTKFPNTNDRVTDEELDELWGTIAMTSVN